MKNRLLAFFLVTVMAVSMVACGKESAEKAETKTEKTKTDAKPVEYDVDEYVTLGDYKGVEVTLTGTYDFTEEGLDEYVSKTIADASVYVEDTSKTEVEEDSIINVDYVGSQDGVAFDGGSAENQMIDVAGNCAAGGTGGYIDGFTSGLAGHSVGEEVAYEVTFPEQYGNADLAGQTVIFTFQINYVAKAIESKADLTDDIVKENFGSDTVDEYIDSLTEQYKSKLESDYENDVQTSVLNTIINNSKVSKVPEELVQARVDMYLNLLEMQCKQYNTTTKDYLDSMGQDYDEYVENVKSNLNDSLTEELILEAIAKKEGMEVDAEGYEKFIANLVASTGSKDEDAFYEVYTVDNYDGKRYFRQQYLIQKAVQFCVDNAVVTKGEAEEN
ncbi:trigger factor [Pseudobutyrivibrio sp. ACV-2]|uniref:FKBP-type peptidyl-prolyl cis-trans isomerase n=1 Tax=Pseudobutyrivibrio sp. ACV-2 TaxID=1520801 RepID=UPI000898B4DD|nr:FKBP-type peptidyl-prolyl cis-trans isomerase [Pseudobutyrivibrio sp. ACV-2]SEA71502.1 trigger factor [Pseudobutyrivibrio sp. ACV-2]